MNNKEMHNLILSVVESINKDRPNEKLSLLVIPQNFRK